MVFNLQISSPKEPPVSQVLNLRYYCTFEDVRLQYACLQLMILSRSRLLISGVAAGAETWTVEADMRKAADTKAQ